LFEAVYDIRNLKSFLPGGELIPCFLLAGWLFVILRGGKSRILGTAVIGSLLFVMLGMPLIGKLRKASRLAHGLAETVEGTVDFLPRWYSKGRRVIIGGHIFEYSSFTPSTGFREANSLEGHLHRGDYVRIKFVGTDILQIERRLPDTTPKSDTRGHGRGLWAQSS
jgi:hypothetical protein